MASMMTGKYSRLFPHDQRSINHCNYKGKGASSVKRWVQYGERTQAAQHRHTGTMPWRPLRKTVSAGDGRRVTFMMCYKHIPPATHNFQALTYISCGLLPHLLRTSAHVAVCSSLDQSMLTHSEKQLASADPVYQSQPNCGRASCFSYQPTTCYH